MRWRTKYARVVRRFALFPIKTKLGPGNGCAEEYRWLETVYLRQYRDWLFGIIPIWSNSCFTHKNDYDLYRRSVKEEIEDAAP